MTNIGPRFSRFEGIMSVSCRFADPEPMRWQPMKTEQFDKKFDSGGDISKYLEFSKATRPGREQKRVNVDFPVWMIQSLDKEASRLGVPRQSVIKAWIAERLDAKTHA